MDKHDIIDLLKRMADATAGAYGRNCEVAVHDLDDMERSLVHVAGKVTGREPGAPITDLAYRMLKEHGDNAPDLVNYRSVTKTGRTLKCATVFVRDETGRIRACWCVNQDITDFLSAKAALDEFTGDGNRQPEARNETFAESVDEMVESLVMGCASRLGKHPTAMSRDERVDLMLELHRKDVFRFRGAAETIAAVMGVSRYTVYNYLKQAKRQANGPAK